MTASPPHWGSVAIRPGTTVVVGASVVVDATVVAGGVVVAAVVGITVVVVSADSDGEQDTTMSETANNAAFHRTGPTRQLRTARMLARWLEAQEAWRLTFPTFRPDSFAQRTCRSPGNVLRLEPWRTGFGTRR